MFIDISKLPPWAKIEVTKEGLEAFAKTLALNLKLDANPASSNSTQQILWIDDAAKFLNLAKPTIYGLLSKGKLPHYKRGRKVYFLWSESDSENPEIRVSRPSENASVGKTELRQSARHNKTETNKTETLINKDYQQQEKQVAAVAGDIDIFFQDLLQDEAWTNSFQNEMLGDRLITRQEFELILFQFREHALRKNAIYSDLQGVKYHFLNWLNTQKEKSLLQSKLQKEKQKQVELTKKADDLIVKISQLVVMRNARNFPSKEKVHAAKLMLESHVASLTQLLKAIQNKEVIGIMETTLDTARKLIDLIGRASEKNGLGWFCENAKPSN